jgi:hypothetical protein
VTGERLIHESPLVALHEHPLPAPTLKTPVPPSAVKLAVVGETE